MGRRSVPGPPAHQPVGVALRDEIGPGDVHGVARIGGDRDTSRRIDRDAGDGVIELATERGAPRATAARVELGDEGIAERRLLVEREERGAVQLGTRGERARDRDATVTRGDALNGVRAEATDAHEPADLAGGIEPRDEAIGLARARDDRGADA